MIRQRTTGEVDTVALAVLAALVLVLVALMAVCVYAYLHPAV